MADNSYFQNALSDFSFDVAYGDSIRHLANKGFSPQEIKTQLNTSISIEKIEEVIRKYQESQELLTEEKINNTTSSFHYEFVKKYDSYGHSYFVKQKIEDK